MAMPQRKKILTIQNLITYIEPSPARYDTSSRSPNSVAVFLKYEVPLYALITT